MTGHQAVPNGDALIEDEALALPATILGIYRLEIFEYAPFEVEDVLHAFGFEKGSGLFAPYSASAEHGNPGRNLVAKQFVPLLPKPRRKVAERTCLRIDGADEAAGFDLIVIARVDQ